MAAQLDPAGRDVSGTARPRPAGSYVVALVLAVGMCTAVNLFTVAVLYDALFSSGPGLSENATQVLSSWGGGIIGVIGAVVGYQAGVASQAQHRPPP